MSTTTLLNLSPTGATAKSGNLTPSGRSTLTSITSFSTNSIENIFQDNFALLATLQDCKIHAPPGPCPACARIHGATKTQLQAKRKATKDAKDPKAKAIEERKFVVATRKAKATAKKKERLISSAEAKATKTGYRVDKLCTKLAEATKGTAVHSLPGCGTAPAAIFPPQSHSYKKCKGITGSPSSGHPPAVCTQLSLQQKTATAIRG
jgi:hypothetical protein